MPERQAESDAGTARGGEPDMSLVFDLLDRQERAAFLIGPEAEIRAANATALRMTGRAGGAAVTRDAAVARLEFADPRAQQAFSTAWRQLHSGVAEPVAFALPPGGGTSHPLYAELRRLSPAPGSHRQPPGPVLLLLVLSLLDPALPDTRLPLLRDKLALAFRLTAREAAVAAELAVPAREEDEIAARLGVSVNTLRTHRKAVYAKLGIASRAGLATLVGRLP
jgi:LuxR family maltose regulon positive regulatory protein